jgi:hypothetical protein
MVGAEQATIPFLFKLHLATGVKRAIERLMRKADWCDAGQGPNIAQSIANGSAQPVSRLIKPSK